MAQAGFFDDFSFDFLEIAGTNLADTIRGTNGADTLTGLNGDDKLIGLRGDDSIDGGRGNDGIFGFQGNDILVGGFGGDTLIAGPGDDTVTGGIGRDVLDGGDGNDFVQGGEQLDRIIGGPGSDTLIGGADGAVLDYRKLDANLVVNLPEATASKEQLGTDVILDIVAVFTGRGADTLVANNSGVLFRAGGGNDRLIGGDGDDELWGANGSDTFLPGRGSDTIVGGRGTDQIDYSTETQNLRGDLAEGVIEAFSYTDTLSRVEHVVGGRGNDNFSGSDAHETLEGGLGNDTLNGRGGDDFLEGTVGADTLFGGSGNDTLRFDDRDVASGGTGADLYQFTEDGSLDFTAIANDVGADDTIDLLFIEREEIFVRVIDEDTVEIDFESGVYIGIIEINLQPGVMPEDVTLLVTGGFEFTLADLIL